MDLKSRFGWAVLCASVLLLTTGCEPECESAAECVANNRAAPEGKLFACVSNRCQLQDVAGPTDPTDPGDDDDAGEDPDGGELDAGEPVIVGEGEVCTSNANCAPGFFCEGVPAASGFDGGESDAGDSDAGDSDAGELDGGDSDAGSSEPSTCQALWITYTVGSGTSARASAARWNQTSSNVSLSGTTESRSPRFGPQGDAIIYERRSVTGGPELIRQDLPLDTASGPSVLLDGTISGTESFAHLEWARGENILWTEQSMSSVSGVMSLPPTGGVPSEISATGGFPTWLGESIVFSSATEGLLVSDGGTPMSLPGGVDGVEPQTNATDTLIAFRKSTGRETIGGVVTELDQLLLLPLAGGGPKLAADTTSSDEENFSIRSYVASHTWSPNGRMLAFVRAYYSHSDGVAKLCGQANELCSTRAANVTVLLPIDPMGTPGTEVVFKSNATLPSFSPDGAFVSYVQGGQLRVQQIEPLTGATVGSVVSHTSSGIATNEGDDSRPRWQPKP